MSEKPLSPLVGIVMGSDSDWPVMEAAANVLDDFGIAYESDVVSAHRMPQAMIDYGKSASERGLKVIIAGAGGAAHLPGMLASVTTLPVIGVPVPLAQLDGMDSLLSIVQMPGGVPVATVGIGNAKNAGLLAARIISTFGAFFIQRLARSFDQHHDFQVSHRWRGNAINAGKGLAQSLGRIAWQNYGHNWLLILGRQRGLGVPCRAVPVCGQGHKHSPPMRPTHAPADGRGSAPLWGLPHWPPLRPVRPEAGPA